MPEKKERPKKEWATLPLPREIPLLNITLGVVSTQVKDKDIFRKPPP